MTPLELLVLVSGWLVAGYVWVVACRALRHEWDRRDTAFPEDTEPTNREDT